MLVLELFGVIGWDVALEGFSCRLKEMRDQYPTETITLKINSPGGDCAIAWAIAYLVENDGNIDTMNIGLAASAAGFILQKGKRRLSASNSMTMMHRSQLYADGDCTEFERLAEMLKQWDGEIIKVLTNRTNIKNEADVSALLEKPGWWRNSDNALVDGLIDEIINSEAKQPLPKNSIDFVTKNYSTLPYNVLNQIITLPTNLTETAMTPEELKALYDGMTVAIVAGLQPLTDALTKLVEVESAEPTETETAQNAATAIVTASIEPALLAMNEASAALKTTGDTLVSMVEKLASTPAPTNTAAPLIYGISSAGSTDETVEKGFI